LPVRTDLAEFVLEVLDDVLLEIVVARHVDHHGPLGSVGLVGGCRCRSPHRETCRQSSSDHEGRCSCYRTKSSRPLLAAHCIPSPRSRWSAIWHCGSGKSTWNSDILLRTCRRLLCVNPHWISRNVDRCRLERQYVRSKPTKPRSAGLISPIFDERWQAYVVT